MFCFLFCKLLCLTCNRIFEFAYRCKFLKVLCPRSKNSCKYCSGYQLNANPMSACPFLAFFFFQLFARFISPRPYFALYLELVTYQCERRLNNKKIKPSDSSFKMLSTTTIKKQIRNQNVELKYEFETCWVYHLLSCYSRCLKPTILRSLNSRK